MEVGKRTLRCQSPSLLAELRRSRARPPGARMHGGAFERGRHVPVGRIDGERQVAGPLLLAVDDVGEAAVELAPRVGAYVVVRRGGEERVREAKAAAADLEDMGVDRGLQGIRLVPCIPEEAQGSAARGPPRRRARCASARAARRAVLARARGAPPEPAAARRRRAPFRSAGARARARARRRRCRPQPRGRGAAPAGTARGRPAPGGGGERRRCSAGPGRAGGSDRRRPGRWIPARRRVVPRGGRHARRAGASRRSRARRRKGSRATAGRRRRRASAGPWRAAAARSGRRSRRHARRAVRHRVA